MIVSFGIISMKVNKDYEKDLIFSDEMTLIFKSLDEIYNYGFGNWGDT